MHFVSVHVVHPYCIMLIATTWKKSCFILLDISDFHIIDNLLIAVHTFVRHISTSFSIDEILLLKYMNLSTNFRGLLLRVEIAPPHLKHKYSVLFVFTWKPVPSAIYSRVCSRDSAWARSARSSA